MKTLFTVATLVLGTAAPAFATTIDFDTVTSFASIAQYYDGGADSQGAVGPALGVSFGGDALGLQNDFSTYFSGAPTPIGVMAPVGADSTMNIASGIGKSVSFYYASSAAVADGVQVFSGLNGTGSVLASFDLAANALDGGCSGNSYCHFDSITASFSGVAYSVTFGNASNVAAFDNVSVTAVPEPTTAMMMLFGLGGLAVAARHRRR